MEMFSDLGVRVHIHVETPVGWNA